MLHPALTGLLELLPPPGEPFPKREKWLVLFRSALDLVYDAEPVAQTAPVGSRQRAILDPDVPRDGNGMRKKQCPGYPEHECGTWIGYKAESCAVCAGPLRQIALAAMRGEHAQPPARVVASNGQPKKPCPGHDGRPCPHGNLIMPQSSHCQRCNQAERRGRVSGMVLGPRYKGRPPSDQPTRTGLATTLPECPCVNPDKASCQERAPLGIMVRGYGAASESLACRLFHEAVS